MFRRRRPDDREKVLEKARLLTARGEARRAIAILQEFVGAHPEDDRALIRLADLHRRCGDDAEAVAALCRAADLYGARGFALKAGAVLRQAAAIAPGDLALLERLAGVNAELGMAREAALCLNQVTEALALRGDLGRLVELRRQILDLLPEDVGAVVRLVDVLTESGEREEAIRLLERSAASLREPAQVELWILLQERLVDLQPENHPRAKLLARTLLSRGSPKRALARLKPCFAADPHSLETLSLLAHAFEALGLHLKAGAAWREIARAHQRAAAPAEALAAWRKVLEHLPADAEAATALAPPEVPPPDPSTPLAQELAEADFLAGEGIVTEARSLLLRLCERFPGTPAIAERLSALDEERVVTADLLEEDVELVLFEEGPRDSTTAILDRIPADRALLVAESATHRDLAIAFVEMERFDEALAELEKAIAADPFSAGACLALAGRCHLVRGSPRDAVEAYRAALASTTLASEAACAVHYELAAALEATGALTDSLAHRGEGARLEPAHREVSDKIAALFRDSP